MPNVARIKKDWENISKEEVKVEFISGTYYGYCSELASLRLLKGHRNIKYANAGYSENLKTFYFMLEI